MWRRTVSFVGEEGRTLAGRARAPWPFLLVGLVAAHLLRRIVAWLTEPSQLSTFEAGKLFIFSERTRKVSTTFWVGERKTTRQQR
jgi:hypothetical protein